MFNNASLSVAQIGTTMKIFDWDDAKLTFAKSQFDNCLNKGSYFSLLDLLSFQNSKDKLMASIKEQSKYAKYPSQMTKGEFDTFLKQLKVQHFDKDKTALISSVSNAFSFSIPEIRTILKLYSFDEERLNIAKLLYANCRDKRAYYSLADVFDFESKKKELQSFLLSNLDN